MTFTVRAPGSTANLGPGFDCAAAALDLWNELEVSPAENGRPLVTVEGEGATEVPQDASHLALRAFALVSPLEGHCFHFVNRVPLARGLGSSAATIAAGLVAGFTAAGRPVDPQEALELGLPLEGHGDNLAAALAGGVCLIWREGDRHCLRRIAEGLPLSPVLVVPETRVSTTQSRSRLPEFLRHEEAATAAAQAALLGAGIAAGDVELLASAFEDRLHEPFRMQDAPFLRELRDRPVTGSVGATLSGSGPSIVVWARQGSEAAVVAELEQRANGARVVLLAIPATGAHADAAPAPAPTSIGAVT